MDREWNEVAADWDGAMHEGDWFQRYILYPYFQRALKPLKNKKILDAGCGNGHLSRFFARAGAFVTGVDNSAGMIASCKKYDTSASYVCTDVAKSVLPASDFDAAVFNNSVQDMKNYRRALGNVRENLKPGGKLVIAVKHPCFHPGRDDLGWRIEREGAAAQTTGKGLTDLARAEGGYRGAYFMMDDYYDCGAHTRMWFGKATTSYARTLGEYVNAVIGSGYELLSLSEPLPEAAGRDENPDLYDLLTRIPNFMTILAKKRG